MTTVIRACAIAGGLCLAIGAPARAQGFEWGAKGGVNLATIRFDSDDAPGTSMQVGLVAGGFAILPLPGPIDVQVEGLYVNKGVRLTVRGIESSLRVDYAEVPVLARVTFGEPARNVFVVGGVALGARLRAVSRVDIGVATEEFDVSDDVESLDVGVAVGGGLTRGRWLVEGRYTFGIRDMNTDAAEGGIGMRNAAISLTAGVRF